MQHAMSLSTARQPQTTNLSLLLLLAMIAVFAGCSGKGASVEDIQRWTARTQMRHGGIPVQALPRGAWRPLDLVNYTIGAGDKIEIRVLGQEALSFTNLTVPQGGMIPFPLVGSIDTRGKTAAELSLDIERALSNHLKDPRVLVILSEYSRYAVSVIGSVQRPGRYPIRTDTRLLDMIVQAGGLTLGGRTGGLAPAREMFIYRKSDSEANRTPSAELVALARRAQAGEAGLDSVATQGSYQTIIIPVSDAVFAGRFEYNILLQPDDIVYIPPAGTVITMGRVERPGLVYLGPSVHTVAHVLTLSGDLRFGASSLVTVVREGAAGEPTETIVVNARMMRTREIPDLPLRDGDQLYVSTHPIRVIFEFIGSAINRGTQAGLSATYSPI